MRHVVIGGGVVGLSTAYRIAKALRASGSASVGKNEVIVLESRRIFDGASGSSLGALWSKAAKVTLKNPKNVKRMDYYQKESLKRYIHSESLGIYPSFINELYCDSKYDTPLREVYQQNGHLQLISKSEVDLGQYPERYDIPFIGANDLDSRYNIRKNDLLGAYYHPASAQVNVQHLKNLLRIGCEKLGVVIKENSPVLGLKYSNQGATVLAARTACGEIEGDTFLVAAGIGCKRVDPLLEKYAQVSPVRGQLLSIQFTSGSPGSYYPQPFIFTDECHILNWGNRLMVGATSDRSEDLEPSQKDTESLFALAKSTFPQLAKESYSLVPHVGFRPKAKWPVFGNVPGIDNLFLSSGYHKTGIGLAPLVASEMSLLMLKKTPRYNLSLFNPHRSDVEELSSQI